MTFIQTLEYLTDHKNSSARRPNMFGIVTVSDRTLVFVTADTLQRYPAYMWLTKDDIKANDWTISINPDKEEAA